MEFILGLVFNLGKYIILMLVALAGIFAGKALRSRKDRKQRF